MLTLEPGPNTPDVPLTAIRRSLMGYDTTTGNLERSLREPVTHHGEINPVQRVVQVDMDYIYDPDPKQQEANLGKLIDRRSAVCDRINTLLCSGGVCQRAQQIAAARRTA